MEKNAVMCRDARCEKQAKSPCIPYYETSQKLKIELKKLHMCFVVSTLTGICVITLHSVFDSSIRSLTLSS